MDPFVPELNGDGLEMQSVDPASSFRPYDAVVIVTDHSSLDRSRLLEEGSLIVDTRDALRGMDAHRTKIFGL